MLAPISWLKEYVNIKMPIKDLAWRLTELGLGVEAIKNVEGEDVLELEITPNRPDLLSIVGIAREIAAITGQKLTVEPEKNIYTKPNSNFPLDLKPNYEIVPHILSVIIKGITVKSSPDWMQKRLKQVGLRPINNLVDTTNYVLWTYGSLLHTFDYDQIKNHQMTVTLSEGGEKFRSLDGIDYILPKGAIVIKDANRVIDLLPLKGGENTSITNQTKNVLLHSIVCGATITRKTSHVLNLRSDSSIIAERGLDPNGPYFSVNKALKLILELAGGEVVSELMDHKPHDFLPWNLTLRLTRLEQVIGTKISTESALKILDSLNLSPVLKEDIITCTIPTYRGDLKIEEDLIEEVARVYGYNNLPRTIPKGEIPTETIAYHKDYNLEEKIKHLLIGSGYTEIYSYSLISKDKLQKINFDIEKAIKVTNPINSDYELLRPTMIGNLLEAIKINLANFSKVNIFEVGRIYLGVPPETIEPVHLAIAQIGHDFSELKGTIENMFLRLGVMNVKLQLSSSPIKPYLKTQASCLIKINDKPVGFLGQVRNEVAGNFGINENIWVGGLDVEALKEIDTSVIYKSIPLYPVLVEDLSFVIQPKTYIGEMIDAIKNSDKLIVDVSLLDSYENTRTIRVTYQDPEKTLSEKEIKPIRENILKIAEEKFNAKLKSRGGSES